MDIKTNKTELLTALFRSFGHGIRSGKATAPRDYLSSLKLDYLTLELGFNSGQFHHRASLEFKRNYQEIGVLTHNPTIGVNKEDRIAYSCFGKYSIIYPLKNKSGQIVNYFANRFKLATPTEEYLYQEQGVYPHYPVDTTETLYLCDSPIEVASLLQSGVLDKLDSILSLFSGKLSDTQIEIIEQLNKLKNVVLITRYPNHTQLEYLQTQFTTLIISQITLEEKTLNQHYISFSKEEFKVFLENFSSLNTSLTPSHCSNTLEVINPQKLAFKTPTARYEVVGSLSMDLGQLRVSLRIIHPTTGKVHRTKIDLFETTDLQSKLSSLSCDYNTHQVESDLVQLTELLEKYRDSILQEEAKNPLNSDETAFRELTPKSREEALTFLSQPDLITRIDKLIELSGIVGEWESRKVTFVIASGYKMPYPLHGLIQASSGKGKSHLINNIAGLMPQEDVVNLSRITSRSLYNYQRDELINKLIIIQDEEGMDEESLYAFRELQSAGFLTSSTSSKNTAGKHQSRVTRVNAHFSSLMASTKSEIYTDNESRSVVIGIDESQEQTLRIIEYTNRVRAGLIEKEDQQKAKYLLRNCIRALRSKEVINPYAHQIKLPIEAKMLRRLNNQFQDFTAQLTLLNQYQRQTDEKGRVISTWEDIKESIELFFSSILFKVDELDSSNRQLFESLKTYLLTTPKAKAHEFTRKEIRTALNLKKTKTSEFFQHLQELEYIQVTSGSSNKGFNYMMTEWDEGLNRLKQKIRQELQNQVHQIKQSS